MKKIENLKIKIFSDGANEKDMLEMNSKSIIKIGSRIFKKF